ncbi:hypothetical protein DH2020_017443 [Rehmannia glutinosa]|uniref:Protein kinase domain-containing protein n=1 Tax=Rehmannia glutinosa TaxID=99300 RepID=A0ABR0WQX9_REHGL
MKHLHRVVLLCLLKTVLAFQLTSAVDFLFNGFDSSDLSLYGDAMIESRVLTLTNATASFSNGRALYPWKIPTKQPNSSLVIPFSTSFIFAMAPSGERFPGDGLVFCFVPRKGIEVSSSGEYLGLFNFSNHGNPNNHVFAVEFDVFYNSLVRDINDNHVGIDVNSVISVQAHEAGYWANDKSFKKLRLNNGKNYQVWIDYVDGTVNVTMTPVGMERPNQPLLSVPLNLSDVFEDEMYVGFSASTGAFVESLTAGMLLFVIISYVVAFLLIRRNRRIRREKKEDWELEYWPHRIAYQEIESATNNFAEENVIGVGGNGKVYKGTFPGGSVVAVKRISRQNSEGIRAFLAEISTVGRLKHRNLVGLRGWCKKEKGSLILVYDYMENGSLDKRVFECDENNILSCEERIRILKQVASGVLYLHYGWEFKVLHRDINASNVLLDKEMNARLGDFGLARIHDHDKVDPTTRIVGTVGYLAPEVVRNGRASPQTDVFSYGVLILEVICCRKPIEQGKPPLVEWLWELFRKGELVSGVDPRLRAKGEVDEEKVEKVLHLGLLCAHPDPNARPTMRQVVELFEGKTQVDKPQGEDMDTYLQEKMKIKEIMCTLLPLSWSNSIGVGR